MGLFDLLKRGSRAKGAAVEKHVKAVLNKHRQSGDRFVAMEKLKDIGTDEALLGLARRFSYVYDKTIEDEQEKEWVESTLVAAGPRAVEPLRRYARTAESLGWPLRVLGKIAGEQMVAIVDELLSRDEPGYTRDPSRKLQLLSFLEEWKGVSDAELDRRVVPYLGDFDEGVRFQAIETLAHHPDEATAKGPLLDALLRPEEESRRIKVRIARLLAETSWPIGARKDEVGAFLTGAIPEYALSGEIVASTAARDR